MKNIHVFFILITCNMVCNLAMSIIAPFFPSFAKSRDIEEDIIGIIFAAHPLGQFIASLILGKLISNNNRIILMNIGITLQGVGLLIFGLLQYQTSKTSILIFSFLGRLLGGVGASMFMTPFYAFIPQLFPDTLEEKIAMTEVSGSMGFLIGPILGSLLYQLGGFVAPFFTFSGISFIFAILLPFLKKNLDVKHQDLSDHIILHRSIQNESVLNNDFQISYLKLLINYPVMISFIMNTVTMSLWTYYYPTFAIYLKEQYNINEEYSGYLLSINAGTFAISSIFIAKIKSYQKFYMFYGFVLSGFAQLYMGPYKEFSNLDPSLTLTLTSWAISGFTAGFPYILTLPQINIILNQDYPKYPMQCANVASAIFNASLAGGELFGPTLGGYMTTWYGYQKAAALFGLFIIGIAILYIPYLFMLDKKQKKQVLIEEKK